MEDVKRLLNNADEKELNEAISRLDNAIEQMSVRMKEHAAVAEQINAASKSVKVKLIAAVVAASVLLLSLSLCTYAYFTENLSSAGNVIATAAPSVTLTNETDSAAPGVDGEGAITVFPDTTVGKSVYASNGGAYPVYVRAKISSILTLDERYAQYQDQVDMSLITYDIDTTNWTLRDGYYYYNTPLGYNESTSNLLSAITFSREMGNIYKDSTVKVTVLLETVQASNNGDSVFEASGWASGEEGGGS